MKREGHALRSKESKLAAVWRGRAGKWWGVQTAARRVARRRASNGPAPRRPNRQPCRHSPLGWPPMSKQCLPRCCCRLHQERRIHTACPAPAIIDGCDQAPQQISTPSVSDAAAANKAKTILGMRTLQASARGHPLFVFMIFQ